ncbi:MAG: hypothetical protein ACE5HZ_05570 [Fidelibacterota bacterium]
MLIDHIIQIRGEAARPQMLRAFTDIFGWDLEKQDFGFGTSINFVKGVFGELASTVEGPVRDSDPSYITSIVSLLSAAGELQGVRDEEFFMDAEALASLPFEFKADFLHPLLLEHWCSGFLAWLGQRYVAMDSECFEGLRKQFEKGGISIQVIEPFAT